SRAFGVTAAQFDKALQDYRRLGRSRYYSIPTPASVVGGEYAAAAMNATDSKAVLADLHLHTAEHLEQAIVEFQDILKDDPHHAAALRGLGYAYLQKRDYEQAAGYFQQSARADSKDPRVHYYSAMLMSRQSSFAEASELAAMRKALETSIALDPGFA